MSRSPHRDDPPPVALDPAVRRGHGDGTLLGGSPLRLLRLSDEGARAVARLANGEAPWSDGSRRLARRLLDIGMANPRPQGTPFGPGDVALVVPVRDDADGLRRLLGSGWVAAVGESFVVDDGSQTRDVSDVAEEAGVTLLDHVVPAGPAAARNTGWRASTSPLVAFVDADCLPAADWLDRLVRHFADPQVVAAAPAVGGEPEPTSVLGRFEYRRSPLSMGDREGRVARNTRVPYVPGAAMVVRRRALEAIAGFDEVLRVGEDVDLVWRLGALGSVRYEPAAAATHRTREGLGAWLAQRFAYGTSAASLELRHPGAVAPAEVNVWSAAAWGVAAVGGKRGPLVGAALAAGSAAALVPKLRGRLDEPALEAARLGGLGHLFAGRILAAAVGRAWLPLAVAAGLASRRARRVLGVVLVVPALVDWYRRRPPLDPVRWTAVSVADDAAYCAGVWAGCRRVGSWRALLPRFSGIPGTGVGPTEEADQ